MDYRVLAFLLVTVLPLASGLKCYMCADVTAAGQSSDKNCRDAVVASIKKGDCPAAAKGMVSMCSLVKFEKSLLGISTASTARACTAVKTGTKMECTTTNDVTTCLCNKDLCNGQTILVPAIVTCFISLLLALYNSL